MTSMTRSNEFKAEDPPVPPSLPLPYAGAVAAMATKHDKTVLVGPALTEALGLAGSSLRTPR